LGASRARSWASPAWCRFRRKPPPIGGVLQSCSPLPASTGEKTCKTWTSTISPDPEDLGKSQFTQGGQGTEVDSMPLAPVWGLRRPPVSAGFFPPRKTLGGKWLQSLNGGVRPAVRAAPVGRHSMPPVHLTRGGNRFGFHGNLVSSVTPWKVPNRGKGIASCPRSFRQGAVACRLEKQRCPLRSCRING